MEVSNNIKKGYSYALAFERIDQAIAAGFPLEAIAIEESIISDRLLAHLVRKHPHSKNNKEFRPVGKMIKNVMTDHQNDEETIQLLTSIDEWCKNRNLALHCIVRCIPGEAPKIESQDFADFSMDVAVRGKTLARAISNWKRKQDKYIPVAVDKDKLVDE